MTPPKERDRINWIAALAFITGWADGIKSASPDRGVGIPTATEMDLRNLATWLAQDKEGGS